MAAKNLKAANEVRAERDKALNRDIERSAARAPPAAEEEVVALSVRFNELLLGLRRSWCKQDGYTYMY